MTFLCATLALQVDCSEASLVQRLREWCYGAHDKQGQKRRELDVSTCFALVLQWILAWWPADQPRLALALDATTLAKRFTVLCISVVYRGCGIAVAWKVVAAPQKWSWQPYWLELDELWSFVLKKANDSWIWMALCRKTRQVVAYAVGDRSKRMCQRLWEAIPQRYRQGYCFTC